MAETKKLKMKQDHIVKGELWKKGKTYAAEPREEAILVEQLKVAKLAKE